MAKVQCLTSVRWFRRLATRRAEPRVAGAWPTPFPGPETEKWLLRLILAATAGVGQPLQVRRPLVGSHTRKAAACVRSEERAAEL